MKVRSIILELEMNLNDFLIIAREANMENVDIGDFIRRCIQQYLNTKYAPKTEEEKRETKK